MVFELPVHRVTKHPMKTYYNLVDCKRIICNLFGSEWKRKRGPSKQTIKLSFLKGVYCLFIFLRVRFVLSWDIIDRILLVYLNKLCVVYADICHFFRIRLDLETGLYWNIPVKLQYQGNHRQDRDCWLWSKTYLNLKFCL